MNFLIDNVPVIELLDFALRILAAMVCGAIIGYERTKRYKGAGIRTHIIVCTASALFMIVSKYGFADLVAEGGLFTHGTNGTDPARIAAQVVTGISFLGAGVIFKNKGMVSGLTTAAGLWATGGIGLAIGSGMYVLGFFTTIMIAVFQYLLHKLRIGAENKPLYQLSFKARMNDTFQKALNEKLDEWASHIVETKMTRDETGITSYEVSIRASYNIQSDDIFAFFQDWDEVENVSVIVP